MAFEHLTTKTDDELVKSWEWANYYEYWNLLVKIEEEQARRGLTGSLPTDTLIP